MIKTSKGYTYNPWIFRGIMFILIVITLFYLYNYGFSYRPYVICENPNGCENPVLNARVENLLGFEYKIECSQKWCNIPYLPPGTYGEKPPAILNWFFVLAFVLILLGFVLNHFLYNRGLPFHIETTIPKKIKKIFERLEE